MTTYNTGNPVPSADARDRYDNSQTLDEVVNGDSASYTTRTGKQVISLGGMNSRFNNAQDERESAFNLSQEEKQEAFQSFLDGAGWSSLGAYAAGISIVSHTQTVDYLGQPYQLKPSIPASLDAPYITTGDWATEGVNFKLVGDNSLRQDLATPENELVKVPTGETLHNRVANEVRQLAGSAGVVDIIVGYGQSNMRGYAGNTPGAPEYATPNVTVWNGTTEIPLTSYTPTQNDGVSTGSLFAAFGNEFAAITGRRAIIANCGRGSQSMASLSKGAANTNYSGLVNWVALIKAHILAAGNTVGKVSVLWCQGEADSVAGTPSASYYASLATLWNDLKADVGATVMGIFTVGFYADNSKLKGQAIQAAQRRFSADTPDAYIVFDDMETMGALDMKVDSVHLNQYGYNYMGKEGARSFCEAAYIDGSTQANILAERFGVIALDGSQAWQFYGGWFNKSTAGTTWNLSTLGSRGLTGIIKVEELVDTYTLRVTLSDRIDYILKEGASCLLAINATRQPVRAVVLPNSFKNVDADGNTFVDIRFFADVTYLIDLSAQTLTTQTADGISAALGNALISTVTPIVWGTGGATITHLAGGVVPLVTPNSDSSPPLPTFANATGPSPLNVRLFDLAGAPVNRKAWVQFNGAAIPVVALGTPEIRLEVLGAKRRPS